MTHIAWLKHATGVEYRRPVDGSYMMFTDIEYTTQTFTFNDNCFKHIFVKIVYVNWL